MLFSNQFLKICSQAKELGFPLKVGVGYFVGRGFADLGLEIFSCLPNDKLLSLFTGQIIPYVEQDNKHLFSVPLLDQAIREFEALGITIIRIERIDFRSWQVILKGQSGIEYNHESEDLMAALLKAFCELRQNV